MRQTHRVRDMQGYSCDKLDRQIIQTWPGLMKFTNLLSEVGEFCAVPRNRLVGEGDADVLGWSRSALDSVEDDCSVRIVPKVERPAAGDRAGLLDRFRLCATAGDWLRDLLPIGDVVPRS